MEKCSYGCGLDAHYELKNGKKCCSKTHNGCQIIKEKNSKSSVNRYFKIRGEENIISVHHYDKNHKNNDYKNLILLCPTHHQYIHSKFKYLIEDQITKYIKSLSSEV